MPTPDGERDHDSWVIAAAFALLVLIYMAASCSGPPESPRKSSPVRVTDKGTSR